MASRTSISYIVGIGASAGGLRALDEFFSHLPAGSNMAFIVVQHLSSEFSSSLDKILVRRGKLALRSIEDGMTLEPDTIHFLTRRALPIVSDDRIFLKELPARTLPIDPFFESLAASATDRAVAVILSGCGNDGARGIEAVHRAGGLGLAQTPGSAKFDDMPRAALATGAVDVYLSPRNMAPFLWMYANDLNSGQPHRKLQPNPNHMRQQMQSASLGVQLSQPESSFFQPSETFTVLEENILPDLFAHCCSDLLRIWAVECGSGEAVYSLAILFADYAVRSGYAGRIEITAGDAQRTALKTLSAAIYDKRKLETVLPEMQKRHFSLEPDMACVRVLPDIRRMVVPVLHDFRCDPPFAPVDLIYFRNLDDRLRPEVRDRYLSIFHRALRRGGFLLSTGLGPVEIVSGFETICPAAGAWRKI